MARCQVRRLPELPLVSLAETIGFYRFKGRVVPPLLHPRYSSWNTACNVLS